MADVRTCARGGTSARAFPWHVGLGSALYLVAFHRTLATLWSVWMNNDNYSHGVLILPISLALVWRIRGKLKAAEVRPTWLGLLPIGAGTLLHVAGIRGDVTIFQGYALILVLVGLVWSWFGWRVLRLLAFPFAFLLFMVPALPWFINEVSFRLKAISTNLSVAVVQWMGVAITQRGMEVYLPDGPLRVENECAGLHALFTLMALGALFAYFGTKALWRRWLVFLLSMPVAMLTNVVRLGIVFVTAAFTTCEFASGTYHTVVGFVVILGVGLPALFGLWRGL